MTDHTPDPTSWWRVVEEHVERWVRARQDESADPWADVDQPPVDLTEAQRSLLEGDTDQPAPIHLTDMSDTDDDQPAPPRLAAHDSDEDSGDD
jgi:hypothetical protein